jgi:hypothetical protein
MNLRRFALPLLAVAALAVTARATPVTVQELGIGANEIVTIKSSTLNSGNAVQVYAGIVKLKVDGVATDGFCIDPFHWSISGVQSYTLEPLQDAPKPPGPMGADAAKQVEQLWQMYYSAGMTNENAAGLQIAIWEIVSASPNVVASGNTFQLVSANDYGAASMIASLTSSSPTANLAAVTGPGQDYVIGVPDGGSTALLLGMGLVGIALGFRRRQKRSGQ